MKKKNFITLQALLILAEIDKCGGQNKAADNLGISLDTLKKYIEALENELGYELLISNGRGTSLTIRCKNLIKHVQTIENIFNEIFTLDPSDKNLKGDVLISMPVSISTNLFPENIDKFFEQYPDINLITRSYIDNSDLNITDADIAMTFTLPNNGNAVVLYQKEVEYGYFASPEYLTQHGYPKDFNDMLENHWLISRVQLHKFLDEWKEVIKTAKHIRYVTNSTFAAMEIVRNSGGIAILPLRFNKEGLVCLDNFKCENSPTVYLVASKKTKDIPRVRAVIDFYKGLLENM